MINFVYFHLKTCAFNAKFDIFHWKYIKNLSRLQTNEPYRM